MSKDTDSEAKFGAKESFFAAKDWSILRKVEALIFLAFFLAVPLFAYRVLQYTHAQLVVLNVTRALVNDLRRARVMAMDNKADVHIKDSIFNSPFQHKSYSAYSISLANKTIEQMVLPENVSVIGALTFLDTGSPDRPGSFIVSSFNKTSTVEIDKAGVISVP